MKKILFVILLFISVASYSQAPQAPIVFNTVEQMMGMRTSYTFTKVTDSLRGGWFNLVSYNGSSTIDSGIVFPSAMPGKVWRRDISASVWINVKWFGAKADYDTLIGSGTNNTAAFQKAIDFAYKNLARATVFVPAGSYYVDSIFLPAGIAFVGENGMNEGFRRSGAKLFQGSNKNHSLITCYNPEGSSTQLLYWYGKISDISLQSSVTNDTGYAITFRQRGTGEPVGLQDMNEIRNITIRNFKSGGIEMPNSLATPGCFYNIKVLYCGGPAFVITNPYTTNVYSASLTFINCNSDGCLGGMFYLKDLKKNQNIVIINTRQEQRRGNPFNGSFDEGIGIVADNCDSTLISVMGYRIAGGVDTAGVLLRPGNFVKIVGTKKPRITWSGVNIRVRPNDIGPIPELISGTGIKWDRTYGWWPVYLNGEYIVNQYDSKQNGNAWFNKGKLDSINIGTQTTPTAPFYSNRPFRFDLLKDSSGWVQKLVNLNDQKQSNTQRITTLLTLSNSTSLRAGYNLFADQHLRLHNTTTPDTTDINLSGFGFNKIQTIIRSFNEADTAVSLTTRTRNTADLSISNAYLEYNLGFNSGDTSQLRNKSFYINSYLSNLKINPRIPDKGYINDYDDIVVIPEATSDSSARSTFSVVRRNALHIMPLTSSRTIASRAIWQEGVNDSVIINSSLNYYKNIPTEALTYIVGLNADGKLVKSIGSGSGGNTSYNETPAGLIDGSNKIFTLLQTPLTNKISVFINGLVQPVTSYSVSGNTITFVNAPFIGDLISTIYNY